MTAPALPPEVERALMAFARTTTLTPESVEAVAALRAAITRALGGDGEPVAWRVVAADGTPAGRPHLTQREAEFMAKTLNEDPDEYAPYRAESLYTRPAATGDTVGAAARALVKAAIDARADEAVTGIIVPEAEWDALLAALRSTPGGGACG